MLDFYDFAISFSFNEYVIFLLLLLLITFVILSYKQTTPKISKAKRTHTYTT